MRVLSNILSTALAIILLASWMEAAHADRPKTQATTESKGSTGSTRPTGSTGSTTTATITTKPECVTPTNNMAIEGRRGYMRMNCYSCHGASGHGGGMGPNLVGVEAGDVSEAVLNGEGGGMPSFKNNLCANDIANLTAYLQLLGTGTEPAFVNWWETNPTR